MANTPNLDDDVADAKDAVDRVAYTAREVTRTFTDRVGQSRDSAANGLGKAAAAIRSGAERIPTTALTNSALTTADTLDSAADYVRSHDATRIMSEVRGVVRRNPGSALLVAAAFGFVVARLFSRDA